MNDLQTRLQKAADEAARHGRTPGPEAAIVRGRQRRRRLAGATATLLALLLLATTVGADQLGGGNQLAPLAPPSTARPPAKAPQPGGPPDLSDVQLPAGSPPGRVGRQMVWDVTRELARCQPGDTAGEKVLVAWGAAHGRTWLIAATPPQAGQTWLCWANGVFNAGGAGGYGKEGGPGFPLKPLQASGVQNLRSHGKYWGLVMGYVTKRATRVQVLFRSRIAPLELVPIQAGDRFPVNFYVGFYRQPNNDTNLEWFVTRVIAYNSAGHKVAECQATAGPGHSC
jgi:hypothetical protein